MTVVTMVWVQEHVHEVRNATKAVLSYLAFKAHYDDGTAAWPAIGTIAGACGLSEKTVQRSIDQLLDLGLLEPGQQTFSAINPKTGKPVRRNYQTVVWNVICKESNLPTEPFEDRNASKVRAAMKRADKAKAKMPSPEPEGGEDDGRGDKMSGFSDERQPEETKAKMSPLENVENKPVSSNLPKMSPLERQGGEGDGSEDKMSKNLDKMSPNNTLKYNYPSLPTGELPASGKRQPDGKDQTRTDTTGQQSPAMDDARDVLDHLGLMRSKLGLSTPASNKTDQRAVCKLIVQTTEANKGDRARALMLILAVVDWMASNTFWLRRVLTGRQLHANWDKIANDYAVSLIEHQRDLDAAAREQDKPRRAGRVLPPARVPDPYVAPRHVHTFCCEHVLADMKTHEDDYDHEGSVRYGQPSAWQRACMEHADELNRRDGIDIESAA